MQLEEGKNIKELKTNWQQSVDNLSKIIETMKGKWLFLAYEYSGIEESIKAIEGEQAEMGGIDGVFLKKHVLTLMNNALEKQSTFVRVLCYILLEEKLKEQEHRRWNAYMRSEGFIYNEKRFDLGKMHPDLRPYSALPSSEKNKDIHMDMICAQLK